MSGGTPDGEGKKEREEFILHNSTKKIYSPSADRIPERTVWLPPPGAGWLGRYAGRKMRFVSCAGDVSATPTGRLTE